MRKSELIRLIRATRPGYVTVVLEKMSVAKLQNLFDEGCQLQGYTLAVDNTTGEWVVLNAAKVVIVRVA